MIGWAIIGIIVLSVFLEWIAAPSRHNARDTLSNVGVYAVYLAIGVLWTPALFEIYARVHDYALFDFGPDWMDPGAPRFFLLWGALFVLEDFTFYCFHRTSHRLAFFWASHVTHHSSSRFNMSVALRQTWTPFVTFPFWLPLSAIGFDPLMVMGMQFMSLTYQAFLHTELIGSLGPLDWVLNTPRHHRVHHGANEVYRDKNFGGVLIVWDRLFGTFAQKTEPIRYGVDRKVEPSPALIGVHGWIDLLRTEGS